ncbi:MAG: TRAP transporter small permease [Rhodobacteraceae bacterium]|nr:TRAP transporter small permease [Paracoccaceae bacterium]
MNNFMIGLARFSAILGGIVLTLLIVLTCVSITGRILNGWMHSDFMESLAPAFSQWMLSLGIGPVNGDFELVESGVAFAIFAFIPLCQITSGHASVGILTDKLPERVQQFLRMVVELIFAAVLVLIAQRLFAGMSSKMRYGETTFLLQFPIWWAYAASFAGSVVAAIVGVYMGLVRTYEFFTGRIIIWDGAGAEH